MSRVNINIYVSEELRSRFLEAKEEYPDLSYEQFVAWCIRYYLGHAYRDRPNELQEDQYDENEP